MAPSAFVISLLIAVAFVGSGVAGPAYTKEKLEENHLKLAFSPQGSKIPLQARVPALSLRAALPSSELDALDANSDAYLNAHNDARAGHGAAPLTWDADLASKAQTWASGCIFQHSGGQLGRYGENLAAGTSAAYSITDAMGLWMAELKDYNPSAPQASHFTQVVWKSTARLGCALQPGCTGIFGNTPARYIVCEYDPAGNVAGGYALNVQL